MHSHPYSDDLSRRERQVLEIVIRLGRATGRDIEQEMPDPPTYSAVRSILRILIEKGRLRKEKDGGRDFYFPAVSAAHAKNGALKTLVDRLFSSSVADAACALLGDKQTRLSLEEAEHLIQLINKVTKK